MTPKRSRPPSRAAGGVDHKVKVIPVLPTQYAVAICVTSEVRKARDLLNRGAHCLSCIEDFRCKASTLDMEVVASTRGRRARRQEVLESVHDDRASPI